MSFIHCWLYCNQSEENWKMSGSKICFIYIFWRSAWSYFCKPVKTQKKSCRINPFSIHVHISPNFWKIFPVNGCQQVVNTIESPLLQKVGNEVLNAIDHEKMFPSVAKKYSKKSVEELVKLIVLRYLKFRFLSFTKGFNQNLSSETSKKNVS